MFTQKLGLAVLFSLMVWFGATLFFLFFGDSVLVIIEDKRFLTRFVILEAITAFLLATVVLIYKKLDKTSYAGIKFGIFGTVIGLFLDTFTVWNHNIFFPHLSEGQFISFIIWMIFAYVLYLLIPFLFEIRKEKRPLA
ncbi:DUF5367 family protein [Fictibacillus sp. Mic-4]|uniref:DUF5367 family protein n=1 Tax=Fictibacillus TaxID=1329200 RepID=UPI000422046D|nr:DUF5367 family protein [Fictibacillus gelatini]